MLELREIDVFHDGAQALYQVSLKLRRGEVLCVMGRNGAGRSTMLRAIMGLLPLAGGEILLDGDPISARPPETRAALGVGYVPQGRRLFEELTVVENLRIGLMARDSDPKMRTRALELFPVLKDRLDQRSGSLSGGERQMLAVARALCLNPQFVLMDEPTEGLAPAMSERIRDAVQALKAHDVGVLLVEQRADAAAALADRVLFMENGRAREEVDVATFRERPDLAHSYLGVS